MPRFGELLRLYRRECRDPERGGGLTQERLAELLSLECGEEYTHQAVSEWERGKSRPPLPKRAMLLALVKVLHRCGGLPSPTEADTLLLAGEYGPLAEAERRAVDARWADPVHVPEPLPNGETRLILQLLTEPLDQLREVLQSWRAQAADDHWTGVALTTMRRATRGASFTQTHQALWWLVLWLLTWAWMWPALRWPFASSEALIEALGWYVVGGLVLPLLIAWRTRAHEGAFWRSPQPEVQHEAVSVFTHQGAAVGFHVAYLLIVCVALAGFHFGVGRLPGWGEGAAAIFPVGLGYAAARQIPFNLWRAYKRLRLERGSLIPLWAFVLVAPAWAVFFVFYHAWLLHPLVGPSLLIVSLLLFTGWNAFRDRRAGAVSSPQLTE